MATSTDQTDLKPFPVCRLVMMASACVITLVGAASGLDPFVIFMRVLIGSSFTGITIFFVHLWFSSLFV